MVFHFFSLAMSLLSSSRVRTFGRVCAGSLGCLIAMVATLPEPALHAAPPQVRFDVGYTVGCRDVTSAEFREMNPDERLMEAKFQVSSLVQDGAEGDLIQYMYRIESPDRSVQIVDFLPKTTLASDFAGNVGIEKKQENSKSLGLSLVGSYDHLAKISGGTDHSAKDTSIVRYELLPSMDLLAASGTIQRGCGVYFKLKPSPRTSLEGAKDFVIVMRVPRQWRGDYVHLRCEATGYRRSVVRPLDEPLNCGERDFIIALYAEGDELAKATAAQYVQTEAELRRTVALNRRDIYKRSYPTVAHEFGSLFSLVEPKIPDTWLERLLLSAPPASPDEIDRNLPSDVRNAVSRFAASKSQLQQLSGGCDGRTVTEIFVTEK
jgi:hypothetical protein